ALARLVQRLVLLEDPRLVLRRIPARPTGPLRHLGIRVTALVALVHATSLGALVHIPLNSCHLRGSPPRPLSSTNRLLDLPHRRLTRRVRPSESWTPPASRLAQSGQQAQLTPRIQRCRLRWSTAKAGTE